MKADLLDEEIFICCKCSKEFNHTQGTWLPIGEEDKSLLPMEDLLTLKVLGWSDWLKPPELVTSDKFTCYGVLMKREKI